MKIVVIHGDDTIKSRERFVTILSGVRSKGWEVVNIVPEAKLSLADKLVAKSLFPGEVLYTIDEVKKIPESELSWLSKNADKYKGSLLVYSGAKLPAGLKKVFPKTSKFESFELPFLIWQFLDAFYPRNSKKSLELFEKLSESTAMELIIAMLARHLRDLYWVLEGGDGMNLPPWRTGKLKAQASKFTKENLKDTISELSDIDLKSKTSDTNAQFLLEILIIEKLG